VNVLFGLAGILTAAVLVWLIPSTLKRARRKKLNKQPLPAAFARILERNVRLYELIPEDLRAQLHGHMNVFLAEKGFIGCAGLEVTDEMRVTVAGQACMLILNRDASYFPGFKTILLYPDSFKTTQVSYDGDIEVKQESIRAGEAWSRGPVILSWSDVLRGSSNAADGYNVVLHEFAHKLDEENGNTDGLPILEEQAHHGEWARVLGREYQRLEGRVARNKNRVLDKYALTSPSEFFAVATESFFEKPKKMKDRLPSLYRQLSKFYRLDPASWNGFR
jgi:Mlc titration factor MtfA (ptsG expression regulator)